MVTQFRVQTLDASPHLDQYLNFSIDDMDRSYSILLEECRNRFTIQHKAKSKQYTAQYKHQTQKFRQQTSEEVTVKKNFINGVNNIETLSYRTPSIKELTIGLRVNMRDNKQSWKATDTRFAQIFTVMLKNDEEGFMLTTEKLNCLNTFATYMMSINTSNISNFWKSIKDFQESED